MKVTTILTLLGVSIIGGGLLSVSLSSYANEMRAMRTPVVVVKADNLIKCTEPRPEICYEVYAPVCAVRDAGIRCVVAPCPSTEQATYPNDCHACADPKVIGFAPGGTCPEN